VLFADYSLEAVNPVQDPIVIRLLRLQLLDAIKVVADIVIVQALSDDVEFQSHDDFGL
jgi:hypothetical protein